MLVTFRGDSCMDGRQVQTHRKDDSGKGDGGEEEQRVEEMKSAAAAVVSMKGEDEE